MTSPSLRRELGLFDLTLLLVIAVVNVNILPRIAGGGWQSVTFWLLSFVLFLVPCALAVAEFGKRFPGEGGIYVWTREMFGDFHAFISGWCYWTNNLFYFPSILFTLVGVMVYTGGPGAASRGESTTFVALASLALLWFVTLLHVRGLGFGKWLNNIGAFGTWLTFSILLIVGIIQITSVHSAATPFKWSDMIPSFGDYSSFSAFGIVLYSLVGLELGSVMGDEIKDTARIIRRAAFLGGAISILLYVLGTASLLIAVPASDLGAVQGLMQAVTSVSTRINAAGVIPFVALLISLSVLGTCSAWMSGAARVPFVMGIDVYLPKALGKTHPTWRTPHVALIVQAVLSSLLILISFMGTTVNEAFEILLKSSVVIQLIPFVYLFLGLWKLGKHRIIALLGAVATTFGILLTFVPSEDVTNVMLFEMEVMGSFVLMMGLAVAFYRAGRNKIRV